MWSVYLPDIKYVFITDATNQSNAKEILKHVGIIALLKTKIKKLHHCLKVKAQKGWAKLKFSPNTFPHKQWPQQLHERMQAWSEWNKAAVQLHMTSLVTTRSGHAGHADLHNMRAKAPYILIQSSKSMKWCIEHSSMRVQIPRWSTCIWKEEKSYPELLLFVLLASDCKIIPVVKERLGYNHQEYFYQIIMFIIRK